MDYLLKYTTSIPKKRKKRSGIILSDSDDESKFTNPKQIDKVKITNYKINNSFIHHDEDDDEDGPVIVDEITGKSITPLITKHRNNDHISLSKKMIIDDDLSPPRREEDLNSRRDDLNDEDEDLSPPRREDDDLSPPRRDDEDLSPPRRDDEVIYRDKDGKRIEASEWVKLQPKKWEKHEQKIEKPEWGKGIVQMESLKDRAIKEALIASQPFANKDIDEELDRELRDTIRWDDPMLMFDPDKRKHIEEKSDGKPKCRFEAPPNRFNILPGYRWDGVIRGNGYEERRFRELAKIKARNEASYINNISDN